MLFVYSCGPLLRQQFALGDRARYLDFHGFPKTFLKAVPLYKCIIAIVCQIVCALSSFGKRWVSKEKKYMRMVASEYINGCRQKLTEMLDSLGGC